MSKTEESINQPEALNLIRLENHSTNKDISGFDDPVVPITIELTPKLIIQVAKLQHPKPNGKMDTLPDLEDDDITPGISVLIAGKDLEHVTSPNKRGLENLSRNASQKIFEFCG